MRRFFCVRRSCGIVWMLFVFKRVGMFCLGAAVSTAAQIRSTSRFGFAAYIFHDHLYLFGGCGGPIFAGNTHRLQQFNRTCCSEFPPARRCGCCSFFVRMCYTLQGSAKLL